jgi:predicted ATPase
VDVSTNFCKAASASSSNSVAVVVNSPCLAAEPGDGQFLIATHPPIVMSYPGATILSLDERMREIAYEETEHYRVRRDFLNHRKKMLDELMS